MRVRLRVRVRVRLSWLGRGTVVTDAEERSRHVPEECVRGATKSPEDRTYIYKPAMSPHMHTYVCVYMVPARVLVRIAASWAHVFAAWAHNWVRVVAAWLQLGCSLVAARRG